MKCFKRGGESAERERELECVQLGVCKVSLGGGEFKGGGAAAGGRGDRRVVQEGVCGALWLLECLPFFSFLPVSPPACTCSPSFPSFLTPPLSFQLCGQRFISRFGSTVPPRGE